MRDVSDICLSGEDFLSGDAVEETSEARPLGRSKYRETRGGNRGKGGGGKGGGGGERGQGRGEEKGARKESWVLSTSTYLKLLHCQAQRAVAGNSPSDLSLSLVDPSREHPKPLKP